MNPSQSFTFDNSTDDPFVTVMQGSSTVGVSDNSLVLYFGTSGTFLESCNSNNQAQNISFTGTKSTPGQLITPQGLCIDGTCSSSSGCYPNHFVPCDTADNTQFFTYNSNNFLVNVASGQCLDAQGGSVCCCHV